MLKWLTEGSSKPWGGYEISSRTACLGVRWGRREENQKMPLSTVSLLLASDIVTQSEKINCAFLMAVQVAISAHSVSVFQVKKTFV